MVDAVTTPASTPVAVVTGAGQRIGHCVAQVLSAAGYHVILHANSSLEKAADTARQLSATGPAAVALQADFRQEQQLIAFARQAHEQFGRIDAVVNTAAIWNRKHLEEVTAEDVREHFEVNTLATFLCCQQFGRIMASQESGGCIVNFADWAVARPYLGYAAYFPSKGAIPTLTRSFAVELAHRNPRVRVNAILPGPILLPEDMPAEQREAVIAGTLVKCEGTAEHMALAVLFLLRNDFITGVCLPVDGGRSIYGKDAARAFDGAEC